MNRDKLSVNNGKREIVQSDGGNYHCYAIKTKVVTDDDMLTDIIEDYAKPVLEEDDIFFLSEKMVACTQGRAIPLSSIEPSFLARFLSSFVTKSEAGIGLAMPETMQCAIDECGTVRILFAAVVGMFGKILNKKGWFYTVAGYRAACIDGPCHNTIPPYNECVVLAPLEPDKTAAGISEMLGGKAVFIVDANDYGVQILGCAAPVLDKNRILSLLRQNPLGQSCESTPMGILRPVLS